ncbi:hypothetical protein BC828DRAFT_398393 [Blastocladiella britannica]|nr:hypothetical protein BC828DRAFT_398393 [Blastocladiella britannica]
MNEFYNFTVCFTLVLFLLVEPIRLVLGMRGNMREQIPELGGFLVLSVFPQLLILVYFPLIQRAHYGSVVFPVELSVCTLYLSLVVPELLLGYNCADRVFHMLSIPEPT